MLTSDENDLLCRVGPGTKMGDLLRRYWLPVLVSRDLEIDGDPKRVRLLGEDLVAFRDSRGNVGLLDELCPHRRASLALGRNEGGAIECLYHGWRIDCTGKILDTPVEPEESTFKDRISATAYRTCEAGGVIWAYLGPAELEPPRPSFYFTQVPAERTIMTRIQTHSNWTQGLEGVIDSAHTNILHQNLVRPATGLGEQTIAQNNGIFSRPSNDSRPRMEVEDTPYGFRYCAIRKPIVGADAQRYIRISLFVAPIFVLFPAPKGWVWMQGFTPVDDEHTIFWNFQVSDVALTDGERAEKAAATLMRPGVDLDEQLRWGRNRENNWLQDRAAMRNGGNFTGFTAVNYEDIVVQESMGPMLDRTKEHLGVSDTAVIRFRRMMIDAARRLATGGEPLGYAGLGSQGDLRAAERLLDIEADWREIEPQAVH